MLEDEHKVQQAQELKAASVLAKAMALVALLFRIPWMVVIFVAALLFGVDPNQLFSGQ